MKYYAAWGHEDFILCLGYKARGDQGVLPHLQRGAVERLRALERRPRRRAARTRHRGLAHHVRRHRPSRRRSASGCKRSRRISATTRLPRELRRRAHRRAASRHDRATSSAREDRRSSSRAAHARATTSSTRTTTASSRPSTTCSQARRLDQRRLLRLPREIFDYIDPGEELVDEPFPRLIELGELLAYRYDGFWEPMDTIKDKQRLDALSRAAGTLATSASTRA